MSMCLYTCLFVTDFFKSQFRNDCSVKNLTAIQICTEMENIQQRFPHPPGEKGIVFASVNIKMLDAL